MKARENKCEISQNDTLHMTFSESTCGFTILVKFDIYLWGSCDK